jgi:TonB family protein
LCQVSAATPPSVANWRRVATDDGEFSVRMPVIPPAHESANYYLNRDGAKIKWRRVVTGYSHQTAFVAEIYETSSPKTLLKDLLVYAKPPDTSVSDISVGGYAGRQLVTDGNDYYIETRCIATKKRVYLVTVAARDKNNPDVARFLSSLKVGSSIQDVGAESVSQPDVNMASGQSGDTSVSGSENEVFDASEVDHKALIVFQPNLPFTGAVGVIKLKLALSSSGEVTKIEVEKKLDKETNAKAIEAARFIRFLPAERGGRVVSQWANIEYSFK